MQKMTLTTGRQWLRFALFPAACLLFLQVAIEGLWAYGHILWTVFLLGLVLSYSRIRRAEFDDQALYLSRWGDVTTIPYDEITSVTRPTGIDKKSIRINSGRLVRIEYKNDHGEKKRFYYAVPFIDNSKEFTDAVRAVNPGADIYHPGNFQL
jgi:hypothetical protein